MNRKYARKYNYVYLIENTINNKTYIGVHKTDNMDDGYMGSGTLLKRAQHKYGIEHFTKTIIEQFDTYNEALDMENKLVNVEYVNDTNTYNLMLGGNHWEGGCESLFERMSNAQSLRFKSEESRNAISEHFNRLWKSDEYRTMMKEKVYSNAERNAKIGKGRSDWIADNPEAHKATMDKINKNPIKIAKTAEAHRGMKRSEETKKNVSTALKKLYKEHPDKKDAITGKGCKYIYNSELKKQKRILKGESIPEGWVAGMAPRDKSKYVGINTGSYFGYQKDTLKIKRFRKDQKLPEGWIKGRPKKA